MSQFLDDPLRALTTFSIEPIRRQYFARMNPAFVPCFARQFLGERDETSLRWNFKGARNAFDDSTFNAVPARARKPSDAR